MRLSESEALVSFGAACVVGNRLSEDRELDLWYVGEEDGGRVASLSAEPPFAPREPLALDRLSLGGGVSRG